MYVRKGCSIFKFIMIFIIAGNLSMPIISQEQKESSIAWNKFDFVPGDVIIFEDNVDNEKLGEFPSKWDLTKGTIEIANYDGEDVIAFVDCNTNSRGGIIPLLKNSKQDYLPAEFTIEFDAYFEAPNNYYSLYLYDAKNQAKLDKDYNATKKWIRFRMNSINGENIDEAFYPGKSKKNTKDDSKWRHISISFNKRALKIYIDDARVINVPNLGYEPTGVTFGYHTPSSKSAGYLKNFKIAEGAVPLYDKLLTDGKIITTGIKFDVNKSTIKAESMGVINEIVNLMKAKKELNFSVEGHTDSDGDDKSNQTLSEARAKSVMNKMIELGVDAKRLKSLGHGESKPASDNNSAEGKANNRRVEFVKF